MAQTDMHNLYLYLNGLARLQLSDQVLFLPKSLIDFSSEQIIYRVYVKFVQVKAVREAGTSLTNQITVKFVTCTVPVIVLLF